MALLPLSPLVSRRGYSIHSYITGHATVADIGLTLMMRFGTSLCPSTLSKPVRIWNRNNNTETKNSGYFTGIYMVFYYVHTWNKQSCSPAELSQMIHHLCQDNVVLGEQLPVPGHRCTHMPILIYSL